MASYLGTADMVVSSGSWVQALASGFGAGVCVGNRPVL